MLSAYSRIAGMEKASSASTPPEDQQMPFSESTVTSFFEEMDEIEKAASTMARRAGAAGLATLGIGGVGGGSAYVGHKKGRSKGQREGMQAGYMAGARRGFSAGQQYTIAQLRARMQQAKSRGKTKKASIDKLALSKATLQSATQRAAHAADNLPVNGSFLRRLRQRDSFAYALNNKNKMTKDALRDLKSGVYANKRVNSARQTRAAELVAGVQKPRKGGGTPIWRGKTTRV